MEAVSLTVSVAAELVLAFESMSRMGIGAAWHWYGNGFLDKESLAKLALDNRVGLADAWLGIVLLQPHGVLIGRCRGSGPA